jgi:hypothetical protein
VPDNFDPLNPTPPLEPLEPLAPEDDGTLAVQEQQAEEERQRVRSEVLKEEQTRSAERDFLSAFAVQPAPEPEPTVTPAAAAPAEAAPTMTADGRTISPRMTPELADQMGDTRTSSREDFQYGLDKAAMTARESGEVFLDHKLPKGKTRYSDIPQGTDNGIALGYDLDDRSKKEDWVPKGLTQAKWNKLRDAHAMAASRARILTDEGYGQSMANPYKIEPGLTFGQNLAKQFPGINQELADARYNDWLKTGREILGEKGYFHDMPIVGGRTGSKPGHKFFKGAPNQSSKYGSKLEREFTASLKDPMARADSVDQTRQEIGSGLNDAAAFDRMVGDQRAEVDASIAGDLEDLEKLRKDLHSKSDPKKKDEINKYIDSKVRGVKKSKTDRLRRAKLSGQADVVKEYRGHKGDVVENWKENWYGGAYKNKVFGTIAGGAAQSSVVGLGAALLGEMGFGGARMGDFDAMAEATASNYEEGSVGAEYHALFSNAARSLGTMAQGGAVGRLMTAIPGVSKVAALNWGMYGTMGGQITTEETLRHVIEGGDLIDGLLVGAAQGIPEVAMQAIVHKVFGPGAEGLFTQSLKDVGKGSARQFIRATGGELIEEPLVHLNQTFNKQGHFGTVDEFMDVLKSTLITTGPINIVQAIKGAKWMKEHKGESQLYIDAFGEKEGMRLMESFYDGSISKADGEKVRKLLQARDVEAYFEDRHTKMDDKGKPIGDKEQAPVVKHKDSYAAWLVNQAMTPDAEDASPQEIARNARRRDFLGIKTDESSGLLIGSEGALDRARGLIDSHDPNREGTGKPDDQQKKLMQDAILDFPITEAEYEKSRAKGQAEMLKSAAEADIARLKKLRAEIDIPGDDQFSEGDKQQALDTIDSQVELIEKTLAEVAEAAEKEDQIFSARVSMELQGYSTADLLDGKKVDNSEVNRLLEIAGEDTAGSPKEKRERLHKFMEAQDKIKAEQEAKSEKIKNDLADQAEAAEAEANDQEEADSSAAEDAALDGIDPDYNPDDVLDLGDETSTDDFLDLGDETSTDDFLDLGDETATDDIVDDEADDVELSEPDADVISELSDKTGTPTAEKASEDTPVVTPEDTPVVTPIDDGSGFDVDPTPAPKPTQEDYDRAVDQRAEENYESEKRQWDNRQRIRTEAFKKLGIPYMTPARWKERRSELRDADAVKNLDVVARDLRQEGIDTEGILGTKTELGENAETGDGIDAAEVVFDLLRNGPGPKPVKGRANSEAREARREEAREQLKNEDIVPPGEASSQAQQSDSEGIHAEIEAMTERINKNPSDSHAYHKRGLAHELAGNEAAAKADAAAAQKLRDESAPPFAVAGDTTATKPKATPKPKAAPKPKISPRIVSEVDAFMEGESSTSRESMAHHVEYYFGDDAHLKTENEYTAAEKELAKLAKALGREIMFIDAPSTVKKIGGMNTINDPKYLMVQSTQGVDEGYRVGVIAHEWIHSVFRTSPEMGLRLFDALQEYDPEGLKAAGEWYQEKLAAARAVGSALHGIDDNIAKEEAVTQYIQDHFAGGNLTGQDAIEAGLDFLKEMAAAAKTPKEKSEIRSLLKSLVEALRDIIKKANLKLSDSLFGSSKKSFKKGEATVQTLLEVLGDIARQTVGETARTDRGTHALEDRKIEGLSGTTKTSTDSPAFSFATDILSLLNPKTFMRGVLNKKGEVAAETERTNRMFGERWNEESQSWDIELIVNGEFADPDSPAGRARSAFHKFAREEASDEIQWIMDNLPRESKGEGPNEKFPYTYEEAAEWYTKNTQEALDKISYMFPEMNPHSEQNKKRLEGATEDERKAILREIEIARLKLTLFTALTSTETKVEQNLKNAVDAYRAMSEKGDVKAILGLKYDGKAAAIKKSLNLLVNTLNSEVVEDRLKAQGKEINEENKWDAYLDLLGKTVKVKDLKSSEYFGEKKEDKKVVRKAVKGVDVSSRRTNDEIHVSNLFGPKVGTFYTNLRGDLSVVTQDRWFARSMYRYLGELAPYATLLQQKNFREKYERLTGEPLPKKFQVKYIVVDPGKTGIKAGTKLTEEKYLAAKEALPNKSQRQKFKVRAEDNQASVDYADKTYAEEYSYFNSSTGGPRDVVTKRPLVKTSKDQKDPDLLGSAHVVLSGIANALSSKPSEKAKGFSDEQMARFSPEDIARAKKAKLTKGMHDVVNRVVDDPGAGGMRKLFDEVVAEIVGELKRRGVDMKPAQVQSVLWYFEKHLFKEVGLPPTVRDNDFDRNATTLVKDELGEEEYERQEENRRANKSTGIFSTESTTGFISQEARGAPPARGDESGADTRSTKGSFKEESTESLKEPAPGIPKETAAQRRLRIQRNKSRGQGTNVDTEERKRNQKWREFKQRVEERDEALMHQWDFKASQKTPTPKLLLDQLALAVVDKRERSLGTYEEVLRELKASHGGRARALLPDQVVLLDALIAATSRLQQVQDAAAKNIEKDEEAKTDDPNEKWSRTVMIGSLGRHTSGTGQVIWKDDLDAHTYAGKYIRKDGEIYLSAIHVNKGGGGGNLAGTVLHEVLHALTVDTINLVMPMNMRAPTYGGTGPADDMQLSGQIYSKLLKDTTDPTRLGILLRDRAKATGLSKKQVAASSRLLQIWGYLYRKNKKKGKATGWEDLIPGETTDWYGLKNPAELITESFSNIEFMAWLQKQKVPGSMRYKGIRGGNFFDAVMAVVKDLMSFLGVKGTSALEEVQALTDTMISELVKEQENLVLTTGLPRTINENRRRLNEDLPAIKEERARIHRRLESIERERAFGQDDAKLSKERDDLIEELTKLLLPIDDSYFERVKGESAAAIRTPGPVSDTANPWGTEILTLPQDLGVLESEVEGAPDHLETKRGMDERRLYVWAKSKEPEYRSQFDHYIIEKGDKKTDLNFRDWSKASQERFEELHGDSTNSEWLKNTGIPSESLILSMASKNQLATLGENHDIPTDSDVYVRIDIPIYSSTGQYFQTIHARSSKSGVPSDVLTYTGIVFMKGDVTFVSDERMAGEIQSGEKAKSPIATVKGRVDKDATEIPSDFDDYTPVGYNPKKAPFFYDKRTGTEVLGGTDAISVGNTVFVKTPKMGTRNAERSTESSAMAAPPKRELKDDEASVARRAKAAKKRKDAQRSPGDKQAKADKASDMSKIVRKILADAPLDSDELAAEILKYAEPDARMTMNIAKLARDSRKVHDKLEARGYKAGKRDGKKEAYVVGLIAGLDRGYKEGTKAGKKELVEIHLGMYDYMKAFMPKPVVDRIMRHLVRARTPSQIKRVWESAERYRDSFELGEVMSKLKDAINDAEQAPVTDIEDQKKYLERLDALSGLLGKAIASGKAFPSKAMIEHAQSVLNAADPNGTIPQRLKDNMAEVLEAADIDTWGRDTEAINKKLAELAEQKKNLPELSALTEESEKDRVRGRRNAINAKIKGLRDALDLQVIQKIDVFRLILRGIEATAHAQKTKYRLITARDAKESARIVEEAKKELAKANPKQSTREQREGQKDRHDSTFSGKLTEGANNYFRQQQWNQISLVVELVGRGPEATKILLDNVNKAEEKMLELNHTAMDFVNSVREHLGVTDKDISDWHKDENSVEIEMPPIRDNKGRVIEEVPNLVIGMDEFAGLINMISDPMTKAEMLRNNNLGVVAKNMNRAGETASKVTAETLDVILRESEKPKYKKIMTLAKAMKRYLNTHMRDQLNEVSVRVTGSEIANNPEYWHRARAMKLDPAYASAKDKDIRDAKDKEGSIESQHIFLHRNRSNAPFLIEGLFSNFFETMQMTNLYISKQEAYRDAEHLLRILESEVTARFHPMKARRLRQEMKANLDHFAGVNRPGMDASAAMLKSYMSMAHKGILGLKLHIALFQTTSWVTAQEILGLRAMGHGGFIKVRGKTRGRLNDEMEKHSPFFRERKQGGGHQILSAGLGGGGMQEFYMQGKYFTPGMEKRTGLLARTRWAISEFGELGMWGIQEMDMQIGYMVWEGSKWKVTQQIKAEKAAAKDTTPIVEDAEFFERVNDMAVDVFLRSQPTWDASTISGLAREGRHGDIFKLTSTAYGTQRSKITNMMRQVFLDWKHGEFGEMNSPKAIGIMLKKMFAPLVLNAVMIAATKRGVVAGTALWWAMLGFGGDDEDEEQGFWEGLAWDTGGVAITTYVAAGDWIDLTRDVLLNDDKPDHFKRPRQTVVASAITKVVDFGKALGALTTGGEYAKGDIREGQSKRPEQLKVAGDKFLDALGAGGIPISGPKRYILDHVWTPKGKPKFEDAATQELHNAYRAHGAIGREITKAKEEGKSQIEIDQMRNDAQSARIAAGLWSEVKEIFDNEVMPARRANDKEAERKALNNMARLSQTWARLEMTDWGAPDPIDSPIKGTETGDDWKETMGKYLRKNPGVDRDHLKVQQEYERIAWDSLATVAQAARMPSVIDPENEAYDSDDIDKREKSIATWKEKQEAAALWLINNSDNPYFTRVLSKYKKQKSYKYRRRSFRKHPGKAESAKNLGELLN